MLPGDSDANVQQLLVGALADPAIHIALDAPPIVSPESPPTAQIMKKVTLLAHSMWPDVPVIPTMATGFSDDRQTRGAGMVSYDISGVWGDVDENRAHGKDERVGVRAYDESVEFTYRLIKAMSSAK
jgi:acetylornithine deacetylase/succinyl-diaminopimelate desuccinylase-like protein